MFEKFFQKYITAKNIIFFIIAVLFIIFISKIQDIAILFFACFVLACSMEPVVNKLEKKFSRAVASSVVLLSALLIIFAFLVPVLVLGGNEIKEFVVSFPQYAETLKDFVYSNHGITANTLSKFDIGGLISSASGVTTKVLTETFNLGKNLGSAFVYLLISIIVIYYFMVDKVIVRKTILKMFPSQMRAKTDQILDTITKKIGGYVVAQIVTMASVGIIMTLGLLILRVDYALLLGLITCILDIVPVVGPAIALIICLVATYKCGPVILAMVTVVFAIAQLTENNFVRPYVFGKFLDLHPLIIYLFLLISAKYMGILGVIFAPAIAATVVVLVEEVYMKNLE